MASTTMNRNDEAMAAETGRTGGPMPMCPMAGMCAGMMKKRGFGWLAFLPGILLIGIGVLIIVEPVILTWLIAAMSICVGIMLLMIGRFMRNMSKPVRM